MANLLSAAMAANRFLVMRRTVRARLAHDGIGAARHPQHKDEHRQEREKTLHRIRILIGDSNDTVSVFCLLQHFDRDNKICFRSKSNSDKVQFLTPFLPLKKAYAAGCKSVGKYFLISLVEPYLCRRIFNQQKLPPHVGNCKKSYGHHR
jgi:hypothetical protein